MSRRQRRTRQPAAVTPAPARASGGLTRAVAAMDANTPAKSYSFPIQPPALARGVVPAGESAPVAMDSNFYGGASSIFPGGGFPGYPYLAQLSTRAEFRAMAEAMSTELTREWIKFGCKKDDDHQAAEKITQIENEFKRLNVRGIIQKAAEHDCLFGRGQIFISLRGHDVTTPLVLSKSTIEKGALERLSAVEAVWTTPNAYNSIDPTAPDFFKPTGWFMLGKQVHASRLMTIITRPLSDLLKPAFNFSGMSLSQLAEPYVDNWLRTRQSVSDLINNFSITSLATDMNQVLQGGDSGDLFARATLFTAMRSNKGLAVLNKDTEEIQQVNTPLGGLHELQAQSQEQMCSVSRMPTVILTGISPSGLNASSEGEIACWHDWVAANQEAYYREPIETILKVVQLSLFGEVDPNIEFTFVPLKQMTQAELADIRAKNAATAVSYIGAGVLDPAEERERLARDPESGYHGLSAENAPEPQDSTAAEEDPPEGLDNGENAS